MLEWIREQLIGNGMRDAAALLAWRGYDNVHVWELVKATHLSVGSLYRHSRASPDRSRASRFVRKALAREAGGLPDGSGFPVPPSSLQEKPGTLPANAEGPGPAPR